ncbi:MAG: PHP-associated domain-containing protein [Candidatus Binatia bacterium]
MIVDLHVHSKKSEDSRASVVGYLQWLIRKRDILPIDALVLTEHRQFDAESDYRHLEDEYGIRLFKGSEVETDYGHILVYGVNSSILERFDFTDVRLPAQDVVTEVEELGGIAVPCHPGRPTVGLCEHYRTKPPIEGVRAVERLNGGSRKGENERVDELIRAHGYGGVGGSDSHLVSFIGICATEFPREVSDEEDLVRALREGGYRAVDFRDRLKTP